MLKKCISVLVLLALLAVVAASASPANAVVADKVGGRITVTHGNVLKPSTIMPMSISDSITQGETNWWTRGLSQYSTTMEFDLYWGNPSNSLRMRIYAPDGYVYGPYYDNCDGSLNGYIPCTLYKSGGLPQGTYYVEIYGASVSGTQSYTLY